MSRLWTFALLSMLVLGSCSSAPQESSLVTQEMLFDVRNDQGRPIADAQITLGTEFLGTTDSEGLLRSTLRGSDGQSEAVLIKCPPEHSLAKAPGRFRFRRTTSLGSEPIQELRIAVECARRERLAALLVRTRGARKPIPVVIDGVVQGKTGADGLAHYTFSAAPGTTLRVSLQTDDMPRLQPASPARVFRIADRDEVLVFDQQFESPRAAKKRRRRKKRKDKPRRKRPLKID